MLYFDRCFYGLCFSLFFFFNFWPIYIYFIWSTFWLSYGSAGKESAFNMGDLGLIPGLGRSPREGKGYSLQCSGLENSMGLQRIWHDWTTLTFHFHSKYISYRKPVVRYCFLMNSHNLCLFIVFKTCTVKIINIVGSISSILVFIFYPFYLFFIFSPLFFLPYLALLEQFYSLSLWFLGFSSLSIWITLLIKIISGFCKIYNTLLLLIYVHFQITLCHTMGIATTSQKSFPNSSFSFLLSLLSFISVTYSL